MPHFSETSKKRLSTCHPDLQRLFNEVIKEFDCTILEGHRGEEAQNKAFKEGKSQLKFPQGNHNAYPSNAVDVAPYPVEFPLSTDSEYTVRKKLMQFTFFAGFVKGIAYKMNIGIRYGGDWNQDNNLKNNKFDDLVHFELTNKRG